MSVVLSESFASDPGSGVGGWLNGGTSATWNAGEQALDLVAPDTATNACWAPDIGALAEGELELDLELAAYSNAARYVGVWLAGSPGGSGLLVYKAAGAPWEDTRTAGWGSDGSTASGLDVLPFDTSTRRTVLLQWRQGVGYGAARLWVDGHPVGPVAALPGALGSVVPGLFCRGSTLRVHSIIVRDATAFAELWPPPAALRGARLVHALALAPRTDTQAVLRRARLWRRAGGGTAGAGIFGTHQISGTTRVNLPPAVNCAARVLLLTNDTAELVHEVRSDAVSGEYAFGGLDPARRYMVVAQYDGAAYRAVIADNLAPEPA